MSGHSKWHSIKHKKGAIDAARGKVFTKHAKLVEIAARGGGDPELNSTLRVAIDNAKNDNVPNANIERAIKKGTGELKDGVRIEEITYEGYGPAGIAILVHCLTDNKNRTVSSLKSIFSKQGGSMGESGSVAWLFKRKGIIEVALINQNQEELELLAIDAGAENLEITGDTINIICNSEKLFQIKEYLQKQGLNVKQATLTEIPESYIQITDETTAQKILKLIEKLEEDDDVDTITSNFDIPDEIIEKVANN
jgi:YebC/PmpR family DNA-binding regulatory protein